MQEFIEMALAHEIKNPVAVALAHINLLRRDGISEMHLNHIEDALHDINDLVGEMLAEIPEGVGLTFGETTYRAHTTHAAYEVDLLKIIEDILEIYRPAWPNIVFSLEVPSDSLPCIGHETSLRMIFSNLIKNAVEAIEAFSNENAVESINSDVAFEKAEEVTYSGEIRIAAQYIADALCITITDNGGPTPHAPKPGGSGLGLAICRNLAGGIGANLNAEHTSNGGLAVTVNLLRRATFANV